jgi:glycerol-3-phosphate dehydrogenase
MRHFSLASSALLIVACGGAAIPQEQLTSAKAGISVAQAEGAPNEPKAALHLKLAQEQVAKAEALIKDGDNEEAARLIDRAQADADLALSLAKEVKAKGDAQETKEQLDRLKKETAP